MKEFTLDFKDFDNKFKRVIRKTVPALAERGIAKAGMQLLNDSIMQRPTTPILEGWLRGSGSVFVQNRLIGVSSHGKQGKANTDHSESIKGNRIAAVVGFNTPYAARLHEGEGLRFTEPSAGAKFLESKMSRNKGLYMKIVANTIRRGAA